MWLCTIPSPVKCSHPTSTASSPPPTSTNIPSPSSPPVVLSKKSKCSNVPQREGLKSCDLPEEPPPPPQPVVGSDAPTRRTPPSEKSRMFTEILPAPDPSS